MRQVRRASIAPSSPCSSARSPRSSERSDRVATPSVAADGLRLSATLALDRPVLSGQTSQMKRASVSETKDNLSGLLHEVRQGETVLITHRGEPVARIESCRTEHLAPDDAAAELVRRGHATAPRVPLDVERVLQARLPRLPEGISASRLIAAERANDR